MTAPLSLADLAAAIRETGRVPLRYAVDPGWLARAWAECDDDVAMRELLEAIGAAEMRSCECCVSDVYWCTPLCNGGECAPCCETIRAIAATPTLEALVAALARRAEVRQ